MPTVRPLALLLTVLAMARVDEKPVAPAPPVDPTRVARDPRGEDPVAVPHDPQIACDHAVCGEGTAGVKVMR